MKFITIFLGVMMMRSIIGQLGYSNFSLPGSNLPNFNLNFKWPCVCQANYNPVCGNDNKTYSNECRMGCVGQTKKSNGPCPVITTPPTCTCAYNYKPVCGNDNKNYQNPCLMRCAGQTKKSNGPCPVITQPPYCTCPLIYGPVCGKNGKTYSNECKMNCQGVKKKHEGVCGIIQHQLIVFVRQIIIQYVVKMVRPIQTDVR